jgi:hypothetical protein
LPEWLTLHKRLALGQADGVANGYLSPYLLGDGPGAVNGGKELFANACSVYLQFGKKNCADVYGAAIADYLEMWVFVV